MSRKQVLVGMSGGVDSSVAAALLLDEGFDVTGVTMRIWSGPEGTAATAAESVSPAPEAAPPDARVPGSRRRHGCYGPDAEEIAAAAEVAGALGIPFRVIDLRATYRSLVLDYFREEYLAGRTPNPCVRCNARVKFGALFDLARASGLTGDFFATGHYARVTRRADGRWLLHKGIDPAKDQSYFLYGLVQEQLARTRLPLGEYRKSRVRTLAQERGLPVDLQAESQDFAAGDYAACFGLPMRPGPVLDAEGRLLGEHRGIARYTIGQRRGLGIASDAPLYVTAIDAARNALIVGPREALLRRRLEATQLNWIAGEFPLEPVTVGARIRYRHREARAEVQPLNEERVRVEFDEPQSAITPGQAVVFYDGELVVGGGTIAPFSESADS